MLIWWRCEGKEKLLLPEAQRLVRIQREIAHGFHRQVETNLVMRSDRAKYASNALWQGTLEEALTIRRNNDTALPASHTVETSSRRISLVAASRTFRAC